VVTVEPEGVEHRLFTDDPQLPGLAAAADPAVMTPWLAERLGRPVDYCAVTPVRYRPGARCVLRYTVSGDRSNGRRTHLYGKVMAGVGAELLATRLSTLGPALVAPVVGVSQAKQLVVQGDAGDRCLSSASDSATPPEGPGAQVGAGGELLARLHSGRGPSGPCHSLAHDARELYQYLSATERVSPASAALLEEGIERLGALDDLARPTRPGHGSFRLGQVHLGPSGPVLIDLDSYCWSEPARDVGNLLAYLRWREMLEPARAPALARVRSAFLAGYRSAAGTLDEARVEAFASASLLKIAGRRYRALAVGEWPHAPALIDASLESLRAGTRRWP
jgi:hypothetical protein